MRLENEKLSRARWKSIYYRYCRKPLFKLVRKKKRKLLLRRFNKLSILFDGDDDDGNLE